MSIWTAPTGKKHKNGKVWDPTTKSTQALRDGAKEAEKSRAKDEKDGKYSVGGKHSITHQFE